MSKRVEVGSILDLLNNNSNNNDNDNKNNNNNSNDNRSSSSNVRNLCILAHVDHG